DDHGAATNAAEAITTSANGLTRPSEKAPTGVSAIPVVQTPAGAPAGHGSPNTVGEMGPTLPASVTFERSGVKVATPLDRQVGVAPLYVKKKTGSRLGQPKATPGGGAKNT